jgi:flagellar hook-length control protein FliK
MSARLGYGSADKRHKGYETVAANQIRKLWAKSDSGEQMLAKAQNVSAVVDTKNVKGLAKQAGGGGTAVPIELLDFGQLLDDSAQLLGDGAGGMPGLEASFLAEDEKPADLTVVDGLGQNEVARAGDASPAVTLLQAWQGWLDGAGASGDAPGTNAGDPEGRGSVATNRAGNLDFGAANSKEGKVLPETLNQGVGSDAESQFSQQLSPSNEAAKQMMVSKPETSAANERDSKGSTGEFHSLVGLTHTETRKGGLDAPQIVVAQITVPLRAPEWSSAFSEQVVVLAHDGGGRAELRLNPAELGPIDVSLNVQDDRVHAAFTIHHAATAEAVQAALPKLEQMLAERGVRLDSVSVDSAEGGLQRDASQSHGGGGEGGRRSRGELAQDEGSVRRILVRKGLVDTFA